MISDAVFREVRDDILLLIDQVGAEHALVELPAEQAIELIDEVLRLRALRPVIHLPAEVER